MTKLLTESDLLDIIECVDELITALDGTNEEMHRDNSTKMCETWDHLNDHLAPPAVVKALAQEVIRLRRREVELENHAEKGWTWAGKLADDRTEQEARAEAAEADNRNYSELLSYHIERQTKAEAELKVIKGREKQVSEQKPFMYGIMTANGDAHFEDFCVSSDPGLLEDVIWEWNNTLADNEPKNRVVALFTRPSPAINLAELVPDIPSEEDAVDLILSGRRDDFVSGCTWFRAAILRNIAGAK